MSLTTAGARVLVVDDHRDTLDVVGHILRGQGCRVDTADGCAGAEAMLEAGNYDVLLVDVVLPDGDGLDLVRRHPAIPAIAATACAFDQDRRASAEAGCLAHLSKPFTCQGLIDAVRLALTAQSPSAAPAPAPAPASGRDAALRTGTPPAAPPQPTANGPRPERADGPRGFLRG